jgi:hypothetical protein
MLYYSSRIDIDTVKTFHFKYVEPPLPYSCQIRASEG